MGLIIMSILSLIVTFLLLHIVIKIKKIQSWPQVCGKVQAASLTWAGASTGDAVGSYFRPHLKFNYTVNGNDYEGEHLLPIGWVVNGEKRAEASKVITELYQVYYNAANPKKSYLGLPTKLVKKIIRLLYFVLTLSIMISLLLGILLIARY